MYAVIRQYSGSGATQLFDELENKQSKVEQLIRSVPGVVSYTLARTTEGGFSVTVCQDKSGTDASVRVAADWIRQNISAQSNPPVVSEGETIIQFSA